MPPFALHQPNLFTIFMGRLDTRHFRHYSRLGVYPSSKSAVHVQPGGTHPRLRGMDYEKSKGGIPSKSTTKAPPRRMAGSSILWCS